MRVIDFSGKMQIIAALQSTSPAPIVHTKELPRRAETASDNRCGQGYLAGLYAMDPDEFGSLQPSAIANHMLRESGDR